jgi:ADP-ribose pyrophosphatase YjhB (NUDIX family)
MFDQLVAAADGTRGAGGVGAWARVENAACARRLAAMADMLEALWAADGSAEREQWCLDNWEAAAAEIGAAQHVSAGVASHQLLVARALRERLPRVAEVFASGAITYRLVTAIVARTRLIADREAMAKVDTELAAQVTGWGGLSVAKTEAAIDLVRRRDNDLWALPGGGMDLGESIVETAVREVKEETGLDIEVTGLIGVYTNPRHVIAYTDGEVRQQFSLCFTTRLIGGDLRVDSESTDIAWTRPQD